MSLGSIIVARDATQAHTTIILIGIRPMFHWTPRRIVAHVKLCVLALMIQRAAEIAAEAPWSYVVDVLERLKRSVTPARARPLFRPAGIGPELAAILKSSTSHSPSPSSRSADPARGRRQR
jgi:hypothetical protein